ncbi:hypothetical protein QT971_06345 [Microcoleus sp. herbarium19]|uniref:hypothetical protein n=1 Tax=Microcoleus sp. herbarium19 TaxID=3055440 RepID=UPI002FD00FA4
MALFIISELLGISSTESNGIFDALCKLGKRSIPEEKGVIQAACKKARKSIEDSIIVESTLPPIPMERQCQCKSFIF